MLIPLIVCYLAALAVSLAFLRYHINLAKYPWYYAIALVVAVYLPLSITFLLPIDYVTHNSGVIYGFAIDDKATLLMWKSNYWTTFALTWLLLPVLQEYYRAGHYLKLKKLKSSLRQNMKFQIIVFVAAVAGAVYLMLEVGLSFVNLKLMVIALSHIYALILALWLMAHGLIAIPRNRWHEGNLLKDINHHYLKVPKLVDNIEDTKISFKEEVLQVIILERNFTDASVAENIVFRDWILNLSEQIPYLIRDSVTKLYVHDESRSISREQITEPFMSLLTYNFQSHLYKLSAHTAEYDTLLKQISRLQLLLDAKSCENPGERLQIMRSVGGLLPANLNFYYLCYLKPILARALSIILFVVSFIILQSEFFHSTKLSLVNVLVYNTGIHNHNLTQAVCSFLFFVYMLFCSLNSLAKLKVFNMYHLVPHNSDPVSTCFYASYIARLTIPLSYNFITLFVSRKSIFEEWYGLSIHLAGLFNLMNNWVPRLILVPIVLTTFNVYDKIKRRIGLSSDIYSTWGLFDDDEELNNTTDLEQAQSKRKDLIIAEAKRLVAMELNRRSSASNSALRSFNLQNAANVAYENNRREFNDSLAGRIDARVDQQYHDNVSQTHAQTGLWGRVGGAVADIREAVQTRFTRSYRDEALDSYEYDDDARENLVL